MSDLVPIPPAPQSADSLEELFSRDPNEWTNEDVDTIVAKLRAQRNKFNLEEGIKAVKPKRAPAAKPAAIAKAKAVIDSGKKLSLDDLDL